MENKEAKSNAKTENHSRNENKNHQNSQKHQIGENSKNNQNKNVKSGPNRKSNKTFRPRPQNKRYTKPKKIIEAKTKQKKTTTQNDYPKSFPGIKKISIVIPLLNEEESLKPLYNDIKKSIAPYSFDYEILFIDDGSTDKSLQVIKQLARYDNKVHYFSFRKNYGKSAALNVGFAHAKGDVIITMDADLQDDPAEIPNLLKKISEGYDLVSGWKKVRHDPFIKRHSSKFFNWMTRFVSDVKIHDFNCGLKAYRKEVVKNVYVHGELHRYIPVLAGQKGFKVTEIVVKHHPRRYGKTKFGISRFFKGFVDLLTVLMITKYATRPLHFFGFIGTFSFIVGFAIDAYLTYEWMFKHVSLSNRPLLLLGLLMMIVGVQLFAIGLLGELFSHKLPTDTSAYIKEKR